MLFYQYRRILCFDSKDAHAPALRTVAICLLLTYLIGAQTAIKVVMIAMTIIMETSTHGNFTSRGNSRIMYSCELIRMAVKKPLAIPRIEALVTTIKAS